MRKPILILTGTILLVSLSCQFLSPQNTPTPQPQATPAVATVTAAQAVPTQQQPPTPTTPRSTATLPPTPEALVLLDDMSLMFWNAKVSYNPAVWQPGGPDTPPSLAHQQLSTCHLYEQGPTEPPQPDREVTLGPVTYMIAELESDGNPAHWYMATKGPHGKFTDGIPTLVITSSADQFEQCRSSAEEVLASLR